MARYIDAEVAEKLLREYADDVGCNRGEYELANGILKAVSYIRNNIPAAYNPDAVVKQLEELPIHDSEGHWGEYIDKDNVIDIVKRGGVHE